MNILIRHGIGTNVILHVILALAFLTILLPTVKSSTSIQIKPGFEKNVRIAGVSDNDYLRRQRYLENSG